MHADCLHRTSAAYHENAGSPSIFVWDDAELKRAGWSLKRIGFVYESLLDLPVEIRRGDVVYEVRRYAEEVGATGIVTMESPDPHLKEQMAALGAEVLRGEPFAKLEGAVDLRRFSRYWERARTVID